MQYTNTIKHKCNNTNRTKAWLTGVRVLYVQTTSFIILRTSTTVFLIETICAKNAAKQILLICSIVIKIKGLSGLVN